MVPYLGIDAQRKETDIDKDIFSHFDTSTDFFLKLVSSHTHENTNIWHRDQNLERGWHEVEIIAANGETAGYFKPRLCLLFTTTQNA